MINIHFVNQEEVLGTIATTRNSISWEWIQRTWQDEYPEAETFNLEVTKDED